MVASCFSVFATTPKNYGILDIDSAHSVALRERDKVPVQASSYPIMVLARQPPDDRTSPHEALLIFGVSCCAVCYEVWGNAALT